jgi:outer membrane murein-binding lipoprotein Lpp
MFMTSEAGLRLAVIVALLLVAGCSSTESTVCQCPKPVAYDDATIKKITEALRALPPDSVLQAAMDDYEDERDALRICLAGGR